MFDTSHFTCVGICEEKQHGQSAQKVAEGPVEVADVVGNPCWKRQREEGIRQGQIKQIDGGGVGLLLPLAHYIKDQTVAKQADEENSCVENGEEDHCDTLVHKHITHSLVVPRGRSDVFSLHRSPAQKGSKLHELIQEKLMIQTVRAGF